ncbi:TPA_exp: Uncharacterized protein A8136_3938 [Trichophyton benhamiae CBS 112371]|uniref:Uncharacterized protein n=1 Tax=Arthroderma benhamiae (strain ATCC MYA-4681 / CBS 112371) TaxID=663331 RepID=D4B1X1_ARTBC|nr:uncharacterized protein ARB_02452 [Trichophyton benhamiae CBS 112371]EFE30753.1 hypothetical protein ARB_02452 [Trichophyton benhamiae CBS 112371]DAA73952.1 TPA_exp: Uncharacterized protein A8136_3938 [Trichophyton benhamiae CBS 112371]
MDADNDGGSSEPSSPRSQTLSETLQFAPKTLKALQEQRLLETEQIEATIFKEKATDVIDKLTATKRVRELELRHYVEAINLNLARAINRESIIMQLRGHPASAACEHCNKGAGPFIECIVMKDTFSGSCANCHFNDLGTRCSLRTESLTSPNKGKGKEKEDLPAASQPKKNVNKEGSSRKRPATDTEVRKEKARCLHHHFRMVASTAETLSARAMAQNEILEEILKQLEARLTTLRNSIALMRAGLSSTEANAVSQSNLAIAAREMADSLAAEAGFEDFEETTSEEEEEAAAVADI